MPFTITLTRSDADRQSVEIQFDTEANLFTGIRCLHDLLQDHGFDGMLMALVGSVPSQMLDDNSRSVSVKFGEHWRNHRKFT